MSISPVIVNLVYLVAAALFIFGLKNLGHPRTAVRGNVLGALGMLLAVVVTLISQDIVAWWVVLAGLAVGGALGGVLAFTVEMTAMPQLVAVFNGFGGGASSLVAGAELVQVIAESSGASLELVFLIAVAASGLIGAVTFWGSFVAFGKLQGIVNENAVRFPGRHVINAALFLGALSLAVALVLSPTPWFFLGLIAAASVLGILLVIPIGGADMPVVVSLLNSYSGLAAAATGFVLFNNALIIAGSLVGAAGLILTSLMCKAMNRSLVNVIFGGMGGEEDTGEKGEQEDIYEGRVKASSPEEVAMLLDSASRVVVVPGYGLAVAQAQHTVRELSNILESHDVEVAYAVHPVAGRMPGHMNVLLAEADVPYDQLKDMDEINPTFKQTDVTIVVGANDVVNPDARDVHDPSNPIAGMPILNVDQSRTVVVIKRSLSPGFAGIPNPLFAADNTLMLFGDGKQMLQELINAVKEL